MLTASRAPIWSCSWCTCICMYAADLQRPFSLTWDIHFVLSYYTKRIQIEIIASCTQIHGNTSSVKRCFFISLVTWDTETRNSRPLPKTMKSRNYDRSGQHRLTLQIWHYFKLRGSLLLTTANSDTWQINSLGAASGPRRLQRRRRRSTRKTRPARRCYCAQKALSWQWSPAEST